MYEWMKSGISVSRTISGIILQTSCKNFDEYLTIQTKKQRDHKWANKQKI